MVVECPIAHGHWGGVGANARVVVVVAVVAEYAERVFERNVFGVDRGSFVGTVGAY